MRAAWEAGVVLGGVSAGSICWYLGGCTDSFGPDLRAVTNGLGLLPYGSGVHYDSEESRRPTIQDRLASSTPPPARATPNNSPSLRNITAPATPMTNGTNATRR